MLQLRPPRAQAAVLHLLGVSALHACAGVVAAVTKAREAFQSVLLGGSLAAVSAGPQLAPAFCAAVWHTMTARRHPIVDVLVPRQKRTTPAWPLSGLLVEGLLPDFKVRWASQRAVCPAHDSREASGVAACNACDGLAHRVSLSQMRHVPGLPTSASTLWASTALSACGLEARPQRTPRRPRLQTSGLARAVTREGTRWSGCALCSTGPSATQPRSSALA